MTNRRTDREIATHYRELSMDLPDVGFLMEVTYARFGRRPTISAKCDAEHVRATTEDALTLSAEEKTRVDHALATRSTGGLTKRELRAMARSIRWS